jgi:hypothetical protein
MTVKAFSEISIVIVLVCVCHCSFTGNSSQHLLIRFIKFGDAGCFQFSGHRGEVDARLLQRVQYSFGPFQFFLKRGGRFAMIPERLNGR